MPKDEVNLVSTLLAAAPELPRLRAIEIAAVIRRVHGGSYFKKETAEGKAFSLGNAVAAGAPSLAQAFADLGVSRATGYRLLAKRWFR